MIIIQNKPRFDTILVLASIGAMLWTGRIIILTFTDHWLGTLGVSSSILIPLIYFSKKGRLGWYGRAVTRWIERTKKKKITILVLVLSGFVFYLFGSILVGLHYSQPERIQDAIILLHDKGIDTPEQALTQGSQELANQWWLIPIAILMMLGMPIFMFPVWADMVGTVNTMLHGILFVISQITIIEEIEGIGIFLWSRYR